MTDAMSMIEIYLQSQDEHFADGNRLLRDVAYDRLHDAFNNLDLEPGDVLSENRLSKALGISRTPVREALQQLANDGLLNIIPGRAVTVASRSIQDVMDALHVRELLEPEVIRLAAEAMTTERLETLERLTRELERTAQASERGEWTRTDIKWHEVLCLACPNRLLGEMVLQARNRLYNLGAEQRVTDQYLIEGTVEHREIVDAIVERDAQKAERLMLEHIRRVRDNMFKRLIR